MKKKVKKRRNHRRRARLPKSIEEPKVWSNPTSINDLPDDLLVKILTIIPTEKAVATSLLSKRWESLWKLVPKIVFQDLSRKKSVRIINNILLQNNAPVLETLHLKLSRNYAPDVYGNWLKVAASRHVRDLELLNYHCGLPFPRTLYSCQTLVALRLEQGVIVDVPSTACFQFLKNLSLVHVSFSSNETFSRFLSACPSLETLTVSRYSHDDLGTLTMDVPSLQSLCVDYSKVTYEPVYRGFVINAPSLKTLKIDDTCSQICSVTNMPELVTAEIKLRNGDSKLLGCLGSAKHLSLCFKPKVDGYLTGEFNQLVSLELCSIFSLDWFCHIVKNSPKLQVLKLRQRYCGSCRDV